MVYNRRILCLLALLLPVRLFAAETDYTVTHAINGKSFMTTSGEVVRLASIAAPNAQEQDTASKRGRPGEPLGEEAKQALETLIAGKKITLHTGKQPRDRHNRLLGQVYLGTTWVQGEMLRQGYAMAYSFSDTPPEITRNMLVQEREARKEKRGIWAHDYYRVITPKETDEFINRFKLVEGKVVSVRDYHGHTYLNFFVQWKGRFAVFIARKNMPAFASINLKDLAGKTIRLRGWIHYHNAPMISLTHPEEIEVE